MDIKSTFKNTFNTLYKKVDNLYQKLPFHYFVIIIAAIIILVAALFIVSNGEIDETAPFLDVITKDTTAYEGDLVSIEVNFSDNDKVSYAEIFYKRVIDTNFTSKSIMNKTANISIPVGSGEDWEYYVLINDPSGNGPIGDPSINGSLTYDILVLEKNDDNNSSDDTGYQRSVFIEECSAESCHNCPEVAKNLHELYESGDYNFHYVTLIDEDSNANSHMQNYNVEAFPVVFVDGGYKTFLGTTSKASFENAIQSALDRETADIKLNLSAEYDETNEKIDITVKIFNDENSEYKGTLKVYLAEIVSTKYQDSDGEQYKHAFLEFAINKDITISANSEMAKTETIDSETFDPENLLVYAVIFSDESQEKYQDPDQEKYPFNAYYVDACLGVQVVEGGNLPPSISIQSPENGKIYLRGNKINLLDSFTLKQTVLFGKCTFTVQANDSNGIDRIEVFIDGVKVQNFTSDTIEYEYMNSKLFKFSHTILFKAYDTKGKEASASLDIFAVTLKSKS